MNSRIVSVVFSLASLTSLVACAPSHWQRQVATPEQFGLAAEQVTFRTTDSVTIAGLWVRAKETTPRGTVVLAHGIGANSSNMLRRAAFLNEAGYNALALDLRAHGRSGGRFPSPGYKEADDLRAAVSWLKRHEAAKPIILFGYSYGAVAALHAATTPGVDAVVADAPFARHREMMDRMIKETLHDSTVGWKTRLSLRFVQLPGMTPLIECAFSIVTGSSTSSKVVDARVAVPQIQELPVLFIARENDQMAPVTDVRELYNLTPSNTKTLFVLPGATHETMGTAPDRYPRAVLMFLASISKQPAI